MRTSTFHVLFPLLDIFLAAHLAAWYMEFATAERTAISLANMRAQPGRVRLGVLACCIGMVTLMVSLVLDLAGHGDLGLVVNLASYPPLLFGPLALASATWTPRATPAAQEATA